jgi:hypothetical protein
MGMRHLVVRQPGRAQSGATTATHAADLNRRQTELPWLRSPGAGDGCHNGSATSMQTVCAAISASPATLERHGWPADARWTFFWPDTWPEVARAQRAVRGRAAAMIRRLALAAPCGTVSDLLCPARDTPDTHRPSWQLLQSQNPGANAAPNRQKDVKSTLAAVEMRRSLR